MYYLTACERRAFVPRTETGRPPDTSVAHVTGSCSLDFKPGLPSLSSPPSSTPLRLCDINLGSKNLEPLETRLLFRRRVPVVDDPGKQSVRPALHIGEEPSVIIDYTPELTGFDSVGDM